MTERGHALPDEVRAKIDAFLRPGRNVGFIDRLPLPQLVDDYCEKFVVLDGGGQPAAFIAVSPSAHPESVRQAAAVADAIRQTLGDPLKQAVLASWFVGEFDGRSYSITPYCKPVSSGRWSGRLQRLWLTPAILGWLERLTRATMKNIADIDGSVRQPLACLADHAKSDDATRFAAELALEELDKGLWQPRSVVAHNDLWWGNFVWRPGGDRAHVPFYVIDWAGARADGMPIYDLVRVASSLRIGANRFRRTLIDHCAILECQPAQSRNYLCVTFGRLLSNLGEWPEEQFVVTSRSCLRSIQEVLGKQAGPRPAR
ncbi:MAG: phosphotransferase [Vitreoscilla sp.]